MTVWIVVGLAGMVALVVLVRLRAWVGGRRGALVGVGAGAGSGKAEDGEGVGLGLGLMAWWVCGDVRVDVESIFGTRWWVLLRHGGWWFGLGCGVGRGVLWGSRGAGWH